MNTSNEMRICVYSDTDQTVLKRCLECSDYQDFDIQGFGTDKVNIYNGESFIKKCGIAKRLIPFEIKPELFWYIDHINVIGNHYYHIAIKECDRTSNKQRRICDKRRLDMIRRSLMWHGKILADRPYNKEDIKYMECTAIGNLGHYLNQDCDTMPIRLKGDSDGKTQKIHPSV